ncbi:inositol 1,4,5-triphosphate receptor associated 2 isoform X2 [Hemibagrus wyckioides]|uniref:inositol 1,4,5-triphosphate receptor associated 2 isoform X2 n=1 Tax=Hemibagrus wyckioides TaxID=337641 RepID=UPI00266C90AC|nr:inositol 1,4,5-triphosphate receptor associated 2 isoform X2 [Hemibagrus wyckioides]
MEFGVTPRRHNPVDSICRKLQTIQRRDREPNSPFQIPKLQSSSYESPHTSLRRNLDSILKKRNGDAEQNVLCSPLVLTPGISGSTPMTPLSPVNATYTITGTLGTLSEKSSAAPGHSRAWQLSSSTPAIQNGDARFSFTPNSKDRSRAPPHGLLSYNLNFCSSDASTILDCELPYPALVVKRLSMGDGASLPSESKKESLAEVSLICEEDLLDTIFQACDTHCRGKVYVSHIVDYLRHTTSRSSEDSGLEELCNMLDPEHKDISIDLDTYHAIMKEWIEDCRNQVKDDKDDVTQESVKLPDHFAAKRSFLMNMTSGSLEAFGGEASRADLETSDLVFCVADLQFNNQKLQEEVRKLKQAAEVMEETNQKLMEENEELKTQAKTGQQLLQKERMLKEEVEEMKLTLSSWEENGARASAQRKQMERENQTLISKIASLQDENMKVSVEVAELQKKTKTLYELNADLQAQTHSFDAALTEKDGLIQEKTRQIEELKAAVMEYSSVTELLRAEKSKLESQMQLLQPDMAIPGLSLSVAYRLNQTSSGSLETELALAQQNPPEGTELFSSMCMASPLDETLDREVLLLLQGPTPEQMSMEFKLLINKLKQEFKEDTLEVLAALPGFIKSQEVQDTSTGHPTLQGLRVQLEQRRSNWTHGLEQLKHYTDSLEKELLKMASNMRRSRTEILHLSVRLQEQENHKLLLHEELDQLKTQQDHRDASTQTDPPQVPQIVDDEENSSPEWDRVYPLLDSPSEEESAEFEMHMQEDDEKQPDDDADETEELQEDSSKLQSLQETCCGEDGKQEVMTPESEAGPPGASPPEEGPSEEGPPGASPPEEGPSEEGPPGASPPEEGPSEEGPSEEGPSEEGPSEEGPPGASPPEEGPPEASLNGCPVSPPRSIMDIISDTPLDKNRLKDHAEPQQEEARFPACSGPEDTHEQAVCCSASLSHSYPQRADEVTPLLSDFPPPHSSDLVSAPASAPAPGQSFSLTGSAPEEAPGPEGEQDVSDSMSSAQKLTQDQISAVPTVLERSGLLPVAEEEEPMSEATQQGAAAVNSKVVSGATGTSAAKDNGASVPLTIRSRIKKDLLSETPSSSMETIGEQRSQEDSDTPDKNGVIPEDGETVREDGVCVWYQAEFLRLSLSHRCDMFTLEKRLRLEERSRNLAEENVRKEVSSCQGLLQALIPLCGDDNPSLEIIQRLQKNLDILLQSVTRVASRSEMLGSIHQESRMGKAIEVMIQHVENLRRTYTKEHAELLELRENHLQKERSFLSHTDRDELRKKKVSAEFYKVAARRVSIAAIPRSTGAPTPSDMTKGMTETEMEKLGHWSPRSMFGKSSQRAPLKRFISCSETEAAVLRSSDPNPMPTNNQSPSTEMSSAFGMKAAPSELPEAPKGVCTWAALMVVLAAFVAVLGKMLIQPAADAAPVGTGDSWMAIQQILWPYTGLRHNGQPPV